MKRWYSRRWLVVCLLALMNFLPAVWASVAEADGPLNLPVPKSRIRTLELILPNGDKADVYYPRTRSSKKFVDAFPVVIVLQGANVDKIHYARFGHHLARHGFVVVIPNHFRSLPLAPPPAPPVQGLFTSRTVITNVLAQMEMEDADQDSPLYRIVDRSTVALAGHSFGGVVGLFASAVDACVDAPPFLLPVFCDGQYERPAALRAAAFYGTSLFSPSPPFNLTNLNTQGVAVALIHGTNDGVETLNEAEQTYQTLEKPSALITIDGTNHYGICDENNSPGAIPDLTPPTLDQEKATARVAKWTGLWLRAQLKDDLDSQFRLYTLGGSLDEVVTVETD